jgi:hypothetical protein
VPRGVTAKIPLEAATGSKDMATVTKSVPICLEAVTPLNLIKMNDSPSSNSLPGDI